ncbi:GOLPH3/VPS74 family protein [Microbispora bryophytorum]|uniref:GOLPH3/VPS74 family protein n=1 Tax=Microbispora bryophytorum TaxID=1460882 RepID=UPI0014322C42|nr:GPP34 family phosphoprotein [Microbispora bryophytorum]MBD3137269.1 GPP34 family phosphoprotein [Microbispora bryophytorum]
MAESDLSSPSLVDDLYFVLHDNVTGHPLLHSRLTGLALAGGVLGELMLAERVALDIASNPERLYATAGEIAGDPLTRAVLGHIVAEPHHPISTWLLFFARTLYADVTARMIAAKLLKPPVRHLLKQQPPAPADMNRAAWPLARLNLAIQRRKAPVDRDCVLLGLLVAAGCAQRVLSEHDPRFVSATTATLPMPVRSLITQTKVAVGQAVISRR